MDLVGYQRATFEQIHADYCDFAAGIGLTNLTAIPLSAAFGDNVLEHGANMPWYSGPTLLQHLESVPMSDELAGPPVPHAGAVGEPAELELPGLLRSDRQRQRADGRARARAALGPRERGGAHRDGRWRAARGDRRAIGDAAARQRDRREPGGRAGRGRCPTAGRQPVRSDHSLDARGAAAAGTRLSDEGGHAHRLGDGHAHQAPDQRQYARAHRGRAARAQRHRRLRAGARPADRFRAVHREPRPRRLSSSSIA